jgi:phosphocarrier protein
MWKIMIKQEVEIINKLGLHARASTKLTQTASQFSSEVWIERTGRRVNAKSIMGVMMLAAGKGSVVTLEADGKDEQQAIEALVKLINDRFGEPE